MDLEQREGRIHRYKGHAVRRNVAASYALGAFASWRAGDDIWRLMFELADRAARDAGASDLVPCWIAPGEHRVQRHVPQLPYTTEIEAFERLKRQLAAYRVVFGQPRRRNWSRCWINQASTSPSSETGSRSLTARDLLRILIDIDLPPSASRARDSFPAPWVGAVYEFEAVYP